MTTFVLKVGANHYLYSVFNDEYIGKKYVIVHQVTEEYLNQMKIEKHHKPGEKFAYITPTIDTEIRSDSSFQTIRFRKDWNTPSRDSAMYSLNPIQDFLFDSASFLKKDMRPDNIIYTVERVRTINQALQEIKENKSLLSGKCHI